MRSDKLTLIKSDVLTYLIHSPIISFNPFFRTCMDRCKNYALDIFISNSTILEFVPYAVIKYNIFAVLKCNADTVIEAKISNHKIFTFCQHKLRNLVF